MRRTAGLMVAMVAMVAASCSSGASEPGAKDGATTSTDAHETTTTAAAVKPLADQTAPSSINGLVVQGDTIWVTSIKDDLILQIDRESGAILQRIDTQGAGPDDVAIAPDGSIWSTGFTNGDVGHIVEGTYSVATTIKAGINPLEFGPDEMLYLGTIGDDGDLYRIDPDHPETVVSLGAGMPGINAFGILADGTIIAPAGNLSTPGSAVAIAAHLPCDEGTGCTTVSTIVGDLPGVAAGTTDSQGRPYVLGNATGEVIAVNPEDKTSEVVQTVKQGVPFDNLAFADDGTIYLSSFIAPTITEVSADGAERLLHVGRA